jgi:hypothetical protein
MLSSIKLERHVEMGAKSKTFATAAISNSIFFQKKTLEKGVVTKYKLKNDI